MRAKEKKDVREVLLFQKKTGIRFKRLKLLEAALEHPSYRHENSGNLKLENFDRLEFLGDSILNFVVCRELYRTLPKADEGLLSRLRSILVSRKILARIAQETGLIHAIRVGKSLREEKDFIKTKLVTDALEALLAALYFDQGFKRVEKFILQKFAPYFNPRRLFRLDPNPKSTLQELVQKHWQKLPQYTNEIDSTGVRTTLTIGPYKTKASGRSRKESEEKAARLLLRKIRQSRALKRRVRKKVT